jgi:Tannase and feruloyl esterase
MTRARLSMAAIGALLCACGRAGNYFAGGSTGGRESLTVIQRWPEDWDGAIALYPAWDFTALTLGQLDATEAFAAPGAFLDTAKRGVLYGAVLAACDSLDGVADGVISNVQACQATFDPTTVRCPGGADTGDTCLSDAQLAALNRMNSPLLFDRTKDARTAKHLAVLWNRRTFYLFTSF